MMNVSVGLLANENQIIWANRLAILVLIVCLPISAYSQAPVPSGKVFYPANDEEEAVRNFDGPGKTAKLLNPTGIAVAADSAIYISDSGHNTIRKVDQFGNVSTVAGNSKQFGSKDGKGIEALLSEPSGLALTTNGDLYIVERGQLNSARIRVFSKEGMVRTVHYSKNGRSEIFRPYLPNGIAISKDGTIYLTESTRVTYLTPDGSYGTLAGHESEEGFKDGKGPEARFSNVIAIAVGDDGMLYVSDKDNNVIRKIAPSGITTTFAGKPEVRGNQDGGLGEALFGLPVGLCFDDRGNLFVADLGNDTIRMISTNGQVSTIAGVSGTVGFVDGPAKQALFNRPVAVASDKEGNLFVIDCYNNALRKITQNIVSTIVGVPAGSHKQ